MGELSGVVGFNYLNRDFEAIGEEAFVPSTNTQEAGLYAQYRLDKGLWGIEGGARLDTKKIKSDEVAFSKDFNSVSASLGGFWRPTDHNFFGLSLTRSERAPSEPELLANGPHAGTGAYEIGNPAIDSEIGYSLEATGHIMIDQHSRFSLDAHIYSSQFDGFIDLRPTGLVIDDLPVFVYTQTDATFSGIELEAGVNLWREGTRSVRLDMGYDYVKADSDLGNIARISPQSLSATLGYQGDRFDSHIEVRHVKKADNLAEFELPTRSYTAINLFTSYQLSGPISLFGEIRNLTNEEMREHTSAQKDILVGPARNFRGGLIWKF
jgi:iron complex outermembrane recepter protein